MGHIMTRLTLLGLFAVGLAGCAAQAGFTRSAMGIRRHRFTFQKGICRHQASAAFGFQTASLGTNRRRVPVMCSSTGFHQAPI